VASVEDLLKAANSRLKYANTGIILFKRGNKLSLRGMLPAKPGSREFDGINKAQVVKQANLIDQGINSTKRL
jgi:hypothetical protein